MKKLWFLLVALAFTFCMSGISQAQQSTPWRIGHATLYNSTVTTVAKVLIPPASIGNGPMNFEVCHDAASTDAYIAIGYDSAVATGFKLKPGVCFSCPYCSAGLLTNLYVLGTVSGGTAYTVIQLKP